MGEIAKTVAQALEVRTQAILKSRAAREAIVKTHILNQYEMLTLGCGFIISPTDINKLTIKFFDEYVNTDPKAARERIVALRKLLIVSYPFWVPNKLALPIVLASMPVAFREEGRTAWLRALPIVEGMVVDSDHYTQLFINCRHDPLSKTHPWIQGNPRPWHLAVNFFRAAKKLWPKNDGPKIDENALVSKLYLK